MGKDYYDTLGVSKNATKEEIKKAYKKLAMKYHPDRAEEKDKKEYEEKFKEINEAAAILADDEKRRQYDQFGTTGQQGFNYEDFMSSFGGGFDFDDIFESFFGGSIFGGGRRSRGRRGSDLRYDIEITLEEAAEGTEKTIIIPKMEKCNECKGTGAEEESDLIRCSECGGRGTVRRETRTPFGVFAMQTTCPKCRGEGIEIKKKCKKCNGKGRISHNKKIDLRIPAGAETGTNLRLRGEGEAGERGTESGDLYVIIHVKEHKKFEREADNIYIEIPISFGTAALGGKIEVPTLTGEAELNIPSGTQTDTIFRMRGKGIKHLHGEGKGDQLVKVVVEVPKKLTKKQKELIKEFEKATKKKSFFGFL